MNRSFCQYDTIPFEMMDVIEGELAKNYDNSMQTSKLYGDKTDKNMRSSENAWVPTTYWVGGIMWHYFNKVNNEVFKYKLSCIDGEAMQYTKYTPGEFYKWHQDDGLYNSYKPVGVGEKNTEGKITDYVHERVEETRKLSCILQLSDESDYEGGETQVRDIDNKLITLPRERGTLFFFDSRLYHRAKQVKKGVRKSLIIWAKGPRWK
tara:strand:- start:1044 stop:1664 length:621 start_codon:yes stop_codon:yes gene_type:complete